MKSSDLDAARALLTDEAVNAADVISNRVIATDCLAAAIAVLIEQGVVVERERFQIWKDAYHRVENR